MDTNDKPATLVSDDNNWAEDYIQTAIGKGIVKPSEYTNNQFLPDKYITRQEIAIMTVDVKLM